MMAKRKQLRIGGIHAMSIINDTIDDIYGNSIDKDFESFLPATDMGHLNRNFQQFAAREKGARIRAARKIDDIFTSALDKQLSGN